MHFIFVVLIGAFSSLGFAQDNSVLRHIGGGVIVPNSKYPAVVQIEIDQTNSQEKKYCSATVVGPNSILTNAHCAFEYDARNEAYIPKEGKFGTFSIENKKYRFQLIAHTGNNSEIIQRRKLDLAIGITEQAIDVQPISINFKSADAKKMFALGYGCTGQLSETLVQIRDPDREDRYERFMISSDDSLDTFACGGDSGGPTLGYTAEMKLQISSVHMRTDHKTVFWDIRADSFMFLEFIQNTAYEHNLKICGYNLDCD